MSDYKIIKDGDNELLCQEVIDSTSGIKTIQHKVIIEKEAFLLAYNTWVLGKDPEKFGRDMQEAISFGGKFVPDVRDGWRYEE